VNPDQKVIALAIIAALRKYETNGIALALLNFLEKLIIASTPKKGEPSPSPRARSTK
jgi:hypothetical protein